MKAVIIKYLKTFIFFALPFGLLMSLWDYLDEGEINIGKQIIQSSLFGFLMSLSSVTPIIRMLKDKGNQELTERSPNAH